MLTRIPLSSIMVRVVVALNFVLITSCGIVTTQLTHNHRPYRLERPFLCAADEASTPAAENVRIGVIEFDDQGEMWPEGDRRQIGGGTQLQRVVRDIAERSARHPVHVVVFVHGWNHSASPRNEKTGHLARFRKSLLQMRGRFSTSEIYGVYIAWRGQVLPGGDYYNRDAAATRIGRTQATAAIQAVCAAAHRHPRGRVTAIGHSMGGVILLRAVAPPLVADIVRHKVSRDTPPPRPMADTVLLVNPADNAIYFREVAGVMKDFGARCTHPQTGETLPALMSITSDGDVPTRAVYSLGALLARYPLGALMAHAGGASRSITQEKATLCSIGFYPELHSHRLVEDGPLKTAAGVFTDQAQLIRANTRPDVHDGGISVVLRKDGKLRRHLIEPHPGSLGNTTPFWIMRVPRFVLAGHNDIWSDNFVALVTALDCASRPLGSRRTADSVRPAR